MSRLELHPIVTINVESPHDSPMDEQKSLAQTPIESIIFERSANTRTPTVTDTEPIDISNISGIDTSNIIYDYDESMRHDSEINPLLQSSHYQSEPELITEEKKSNNSKDS